MATILDLARQHRRETAVTAGIALGAPLVLVCLAAPAMLPRIVLDVGNACACAVTVSRG